MPKFYLSISLLILTISQFFLQGVISSATFTFLNECNQTIWPVIFTNAGITPLQPTGFALQKGDSKTLNASSSWAGRFWGRTHCSENSTGKFTCATGDCGSGKLACSGVGAIPPATLAEFTLDGFSGMDFFDVSLVDGYNLPILVAPTGGTGRNCNYTGCMVDLNGVCPSELKVMNNESVVACKSACEAFGDSEYCCSGAYGTPDTCKPSSYSQFFKDACPGAYSYAYDDSATTVACSGADYQITFCPSSTTRKKSTEGQPTPPTPNSTPNSIPQFGDGVYEGDDEMETSGSLRRYTYIYMVVIPAIIAVSFL